MKSSTNVHLKGRTHNALSVAHAPLMQPITKDLSKLANLRIPTSIRYVQSSAPQRILGSHATIHHRKDNSNRGNKNRDFNWGLQ